MPGAGDGARAAAGAGTPIPLALGPWRIELGSVLLRLAY